MFHSKHWLQYIIGRYSCICNKSYYAFIITSRITTNARKASKNNIYTVQNTSYKTSLSEIFRRVQIKPFWSFIPNITHVSDKKIFLSSWKFDSNNNPVYNRSNTSCFSGDFSHAKQYFLSYRFRRHRKSLFFTSQTIRIIWFYYNL